MESKLNILLTGASGFLGSALARAWATAGHRITVLVRGSSSLERLRQVTDRLDIRSIEGDAATLALVRGLAPDAIVHTACAYGRQGETLLQLHDANVGFGISLLQAALDANDTPVTFLNTGTVLDASVSHYARSKQNFSAWGRQLAGERPEQLRFVNVALQHMYGPGDADSKFTSHVIRACMRGVDELKLTAGEQRRDFVYIDDVVSGYTTLLLQRQALAAVEDIELGLGEAPPVRSFVETAHRLAGASTRLAFGALPYRANEAMHCCADITRLRALGWRPEFNIEAGIARTIRLETNQP